MTKRRGKRQHGQGWEPLLSTLWNGVVKLALDALGFSVRAVTWTHTPVAQTPLRTDSRRSIVHFLVSDWAISFLPILAAGLYGTQSSRPGNKVITSPLSASFKFQLRPNPTLNGNPCLHAVGQPHSDGQSPLPASRSTLLESSLETVEEVLDPTNKADWVHFACHGIQDADNPIESGLCIAARRRLKLSDIIASSRPRGGPAFFVCVQTATGDKDLSDAVIHTAAGMLLAEHRDVVSTMWSSSDWLAPRVPNLDVYEHLFRSDTRPVGDPARRSCR